MEARWMQVELMGHRTIVGLVDEVEMFGAKFGRVRTPGRRKGDECGGCLGKGVVRRYASFDLSDAVMPCPEGCSGGWIVEADPAWIGEDIFSPAAVYRLSPSTEEEARRIAKLVANHRVSDASRTASLPEPGPTDDDIPFPPDPVPVSPPAPPVQWTGTVPIGPDGKPDYSLIPF